MTPPQPPERPTFLERPRFLYALIIGVFLLATGYFAIVSYFISDSSARGEFGDAFGAINAIFTGLAFTAVIYGVILQRREIRIQQRELLETRKVFRQQSFETLFFSVQQVLAETVSAIEWRVLNPHHNGIKYEQVSGRLALKAIAASVYQEHAAKMEQLARKSADIPEIQIEMLLKTYVKFYTRNESLLGNYFRLVYNILKIISESDFCAEDKERYAHLFRAQLSEGELTLIVLNGMVDLGKKMRTYLEEFSMLKHATMEGRDIPDPRKVFHANAFLDRDERNPKK